nr:hypothetical protein [Pseudomonas aeruginosa]
MFSEMPGARLLADRGGTLSAISSHRKKPMSIEREEVDGFEVAYSVQVDNSRMLELLVDEIETGDCFWQITNSCGQILDRSDRYEDQAHCLRDGLNKSLAKEIS